MGVPMLEWGGVWDARRPKLRTRGGILPLIRRFAL